MPTSQSRIWTLDDKLMEPVDRCTRPIPSAGANRGMRRSRAPSLVWEGQLES